MHVRILVRRVGPLPDWLIVLLYDSILQWKDCHYFVRFRLHGLARQCHRLFRPNNIF